MSMTPELSSWTQGASGIGSAAAAAAPPFWALPQRRPRTSGDQACSLSLLACVENNKLPETLLCSRRNVLQVAFVNACEPVSTSADFWLSSGHHLLDRNDDGCVLVTDEFLKAYLARPEMIPPPDACIAEQTLYAALLSNPREPVTPAQIAAIEDADARENWGFMISWRDHVIQHPTLEAAYLAIVREGQGFPPLFVSQIVQVILRNMLDDCQDAFVLRAAEMFFRAQKLALHEGSLLAVDEETYADAGSRPSPLVSLLGLQAAPDIDVLSEANAHSYWERSDSFDFAFDLTAGRRGVAALGDSPNSGCNICFRSMSRSRL